MIKDLGFSNLDGNNFRNVSKGCLLRSILIIVLGGVINHHSLPGQIADPEGKIQILECIEVDSVPADFPVSFAFLHYENWQFIGYYNQHRSLSIASRKVSDKKWNYMILPTQVGWDSHNRIVMSIDRDHCVHVSGNMHNDSMIYFKTEVPYDISTFTRVFPLVSVEDELSSTYPKFIKNARQQLIYSYRKGGSGKGVTIANIYDEETKSFSRLTDHPLFDGLGEMSAYANGPRLGPDQLFHVVWLWRDTPGCETNHDLSYARSPDLVSWETMNGTRIGLPITPQSNQCTVDAVPVRGGAINGNTDLFFDGIHPMIAYLKYDSMGKSQIYVSRVMENQWISHQVSNWNYRWEFSGPGSIEFKIRIQDCMVTPEGKIEIKYQHIKRGRGVLIIDKNSLALLEDRHLPPTGNKTYPPELLEPTSKIDGMDVRWIRSALSNQNPNIYYALRWETLGKRRYYKPPENPVKPTSLKLYRFQK